MTASFKEIVIKKGAIKVNITFIAPFLANMI